MLAYRKRSVAPLVHVLSVSGELGLREVGPPLPRISTDPERKNLWFP